jgi:hypothetical protein
MFICAQKAFLASAAVVGLGAAVARATPTIVNFDDAQADVVPQTYGSDSFNWGNNQFLTESDSDYKGPQSQYQNSYGAPSAPNAITNGDGAAVTEVQRTFPLNFSSVAVSSFVGFDTYQATSATTLTITGLRLGVVVGTKTVALDNAGYHNVPTNWRDIDTVRFTASGSEVPNQGGFFLMDNFTYTGVTPGDANDSGKVDFSDLLTLAQNYNQSGKNWEQGDFNNDHSVNFTDLLTLAQHYNDVESAAQFASLSPAFRADVQAAFAQVPEPASASLVAVAGLGLLARRRKIA